MALTFPSDLFPQDVVASVSGLSGFAAGAMGSLFTFAAGAIVDKYSYLPVFIAAGVIPLLATAAVLILIRAPQVTAT
jgi:ACS family hexuronate transporter-like MFS transporter